jgi:hypothetical protein
VGKVEPSDTWENFPPAIEQSLGKDDDFSRMTYTRPEKYRDSPVSLQIVTRCLQEEKNLAIMEKVIQAVELKRQLSRAVPDGYIFSDSYPWRIAFSILGK